MFPGFLLQIFPAGCKVWFDFRRKDSWPDAWSWAAFAVCTQHRKDETVGSNHIHSPIHNFLTCRILDAWALPWFAWLEWVQQCCLYYVVSRFLARPVELKCYSAEPDDSLRPLFEAIVYSRSWVSKSVNSPCIWLWQCFSSNTLGSSRLWLNWLMHTSQ